MSNACSILCVTSFSQFYDNLLWWNLTPFNGVKISIHLHTKKTEDNMLINSKIELSLPEVWSELIGSSEVSLG